MAREFDDDIDDLLNMLVDDDTPAAQEDRSADTATAPAAVDDDDGGAAQTDPEPVRRVAPPAHVEEEVQGRSHRRRGLIAVLLASAAINVSAIVVAVLWWTGRVDPFAGGGDPTVAGEVGAAMSTVGGSASADAGSSAVGLQSTTEQATSTSEELATITSVAPSPDNPEGAVRYAVFSAGAVHLRGLVPSQDVADEHVASAEALLGTGNVVDEYQVDPAAPAEAVDTPIYFEDAVLFELNSTEIAPDFYPILDLVTLFLGQNPESSITVVARTDASGPQDLNQRIATERAQAVIDYWLANGVDPDQVIADPRGEEGASEDDDAQTAARRRRVELVIKDLLQEP